MTTKQTPSPEFPSSDIHQSTFFEMHGNPARLELQGNHVMFMHRADAELYKLIQRFNSNDELVPLSRFVSALKSLRSRMLSMRPPR